MGMVPYPEGKGISITEKEASPAKAPHRGKTGLTTGGTSQKNVPPLGGGERPFVNGNPSFFNGKDL